MGVRFTDRAEADLENISDFIAADSPVRARTFVLELREACLSLAKHPHRFALAQSVSDPELHRRPFGNYLIYYRVTSETVVISRILNAARDQRHIEFPGN